LRVVSKRLSQIWTIPTLSGYGAAKTDPEGAFGIGLEIKLPLEEDALRLEGKRQKARSASKKRSRPNA